MSTNFENSEEKRINCEGGFGIIPFYLSRDKSIPDGAKLLFSDMWLAQIQTGYCSLSNSELAEIRNVSVRTITNWLSLLKEKSWIKTQYIMTQQGEIKQRNIYLNPKPEINNVVEKISEADFYTPRNQFLYPLETSFQVYNIREDINNKILKNTKKGDPMENNIPASGSPSSPKVDELRLAEEIFYNKFWVLVPNKVNIAKAKNRFFQITNNCKNEKKVNEVIEGYKRYLVYIENEHKKNKFQRRYQDPSTFLNVKEEKWLDPWEFVEEEPAKKETTPQIQQPKDVERRIRIARKLKLLDNFLPDEYDREWKFIPKEVKEILISKDVENYIKDIKTSEETLITQIACVTMIGKDGYMTWKDKYEEETGERPTYDLEFYIPFGKKLPNDIWKWLLKYSHNFGLPSERKIDEARQWYYKSDHSAAWNLFA